MASPYRELKERVWIANQEIPRRGLAIHTTGVTFAGESGGYVKLSAAPGQWNVVASGSAAR